MSTTTISTLGPSTATASDLDQLSINTIRGLALDMIHRAHSGHPGTPMGIAPVAYTLWNHVLRFDPTNPIWPNRDRFVLSVGHASTLLWSVLHLAGVRAVSENHEVSSDMAVTTADLESFRQLGSRCPGHPEYGLTTGVETTTGPLGQGVANSVGMAIAGRWLADRYNRPGYTLFDFDVYALAGDGCLMEGLGYEAASLAGHLGLSHLCWIYDSNRVTLEGHTSIAFTEDVAARFRACGWNVVTVADVNDVRSIRRALDTFRSETERPTLIVVHSHIGYGSPAEDMHTAHGTPFDADGVRSTKEFFGMPVDRKFWVPEEVREHFAAGIGARGPAAGKHWDSLLSGYQVEYPALATELDLMQRRQMPVGWDDEIPAFPADETGMETRAASAAVLNKIAERVPWLLSGAADLDPCTKTRLTFAGAGDHQVGTPGGRNLHFGVREHAAAAVANGLSVSNLRPLWAGFLTFTDYARGAMRLSALMAIPVIHVSSHDSISIGEDGPTHQAIEQLASLRAMPGMLVFRPADANEVAETWRCVMQLHDRPASIVLCKQALPTFDRTEFGSAAGVARGAYVLADARNGAEPDVILLATGSEVALAMQARTILSAEGTGVRVVSMPCWELFELQDAAYRDSVLPPSVCARVSVEQASKLGWREWVGEHGEIVGMETFGASAPMAKLQSTFGFTPEHIADVARDVLARPRP